MSVTEAENSTNRIPSEQGSERMPIPQAVAETPTFTHSPEHEKLQKETLENLDFLYYCLQSEAGDCTLSVDWHAATKLLTTALETKVPQTAAMHQSYQLSAQKSAETRALVEQDAEFCRSFAEELRTHGPLQVINNPAIVLPRFKKIEIVNYLIVATAHKVHTAIAYNLETGAEYYNDQLLELSRQRREQMRRRAFEQTIAVIDGPLLEHEVNELKNQALHFDFKNSELPGTYKELMTDSLMQALSCYCPIEDQPVAYQNFVDRMFVLDRQLSDTLAQQRLPESAQAVALWKQAILTLSLNLAKSIVTNPGHAATLKQSAETTLNTLHQDAAEPVKPEVITPLEGEQPAKRTRRRRSIKTRQVGGRYEAVSGLEQHVDDGAHFVMDTGRLMKAVVAIQVERRAGLEPFNPDSQEAWAALKAKQPTVLEVVRAYSTYVPWTKEGLQDRLTGLLLCSTRALMSEPFTEQRLGDLETRTNERRSDYLRVLQHVITTNTVTELDLRRSADYRLHREISRHSDKQPRAVALERRSAIAKNLQRALAVKLESGVEEERMARAVAEVERRRA
jgi:hypothetical protein